MRHYRITLADALAAHDSALAIRGRSGVANLPLIESAIARPYSGYHRRIFGKAAALLQSVACNHGFVDGNKRTAWLLVTLPIERSGYDLLVSDHVRIDDFVVSVVELTTDLDAIERWFAIRLVKAAI